jgi:hypothetical protein
MPEWLVAIIVAACVVFIVLGMTFFIVFLMELPRLIDSIQRRLYYESEFRDKK